MRTYLPRALACAATLALVLMATACYPTTNPTGITDACASKPLYTGTHDVYDTGAVIDNMRVIGNISFYGDHQRLTNSCVYGNGDVGIVGIRPPTTNFLMDSTIVAAQNHCAVFTDPSQVTFDCKRDYGVLVFDGSSGITLTRDDISDAVQGVNLAGSNATMNFDRIHDLAYTSSIGTGDHLDGLIVQNSNKNIDIESSDISIGPASTPGQTAAVYLDEDFGAGFVNLTFKNNHIHNGGTAACLQPPEKSQSAVITGNDFGPVCNISGTPHVGASHNSFVHGGTNVWDNNYWTDQDHTVPANKIPWP